MYTFLSIIFLLCLLASGLGVVFGKGVRLISSVLVCLLLFGAAPLINKLKPADQIEAEAARNAAKVAATTVHSDTELKFVGVEAVKEKLTDPASAKFRNIAVYRKSNGSFSVCGEVNSKNRAGGYSGYELFISGGVGGNTFVGEEMSEPRKTAGLLCHAD